MLTRPEKYTFNQRVDVIVPTSNIREPFLRDPIHKVEFCELSQGGKACGGISCVMHYLPAPGHWPIRALARHSNHPIGSWQLGHVIEHPIIDLRSGWRSSSSGCTGRGRGASRSLSRWATGRTRCTRPSWPSRPSVTTVISFLFFPANRWLLVSKPFLHAPSLLLTHLSSSCAAEPPCSWPPSSHPPTAHHYCPKFLFATRNSFQLPLHCTMCSLFNIFFHATKQAETYIKFEFSYPIVHMFVPACSFIHIFVISNSNSVISPLNMPLYPPLRPQICPCNHPFSLLYCIQGHFRYRGIVLNKQHIVHYRERALL